MKTHRVRSEVNNVVTVLLYLHECVILALLTVLVWAVFHGFRRGVFSLVIKVLLIIVLYGLTWVGFILLSAIL